MEAIRKARILIRALRHDPTILNIDLDKRGWANVSDVLKSLNIDRPCLDVIVDTDDKGRFEYNERRDRIRATHGHSIKKLEVYKDWRDFIPSDPLYHGTAEASIGPILRSKLVSKTRTHVHLSSDIETAYMVGKRHGDPIILQIDAVQMKNDGYKFYQSQSGIVLTDEISSKYIKVLDNGHLSQMGYFFK